MSKILLVYISLGFQRKGNTQCNMGIEECQSPNDPSPPPPIHHDLAQPKVDYLISKYRGKLQ